MFGMDRLLSDGALRKELAGRRVALLAHPASVTADLRHSLDALKGCRDLNVTSAFGPQHGLRGDKQDNMLESPDFLDPRHRIPVFSLYPDFLAKSALSEEERRAIGRIHPMLMGGEYLPDMDAQEVEIARISIHSVTSDVTSVYARRGQDGIAYRVVDEYEGETLTDDSERSSKGRLSLGELALFFIGASGCRSRRPGGGAVPRPWTPAPQPSATGRCAGRSASSGYSSSTLRVAQAAAVRCGSWPASRTRW